MAKPKTLDKSLTYYLILTGIWVIFNFFLTDFYSALTVDSITDLSKTLIETVGILVGLLGVSSFFYLGKLEEIIDRDYSNVNELMRDSEENKDVALRTYESHRKSEAFWIEKCKACKKSEVGDHFSGESKARKLQNSIALKRIKDRRGNDWSKQ
jgi:hypothetical protein